MKLIYSIAFTCLLFGSCQKDDYTCTCIDASGIGSVKETTLSKRSQSKAVSSCIDQQTDLNMTGTNYKCTLKP